ncbi:hypothetical protein ACTA71_004563 [Dictyostelium dimigraforme]
MDFLKLPTTESGMDQVLVKVDKLGKMVKIIVRRSITSAEVAEIFWKKIVCNFGLPLSIVSDNDKLFTSELWTNLMNEAIIQQFNNRQSKTKKLNIITTKTNTNQFQQQTTKTTKN